MLPKLPLLVFHRAQKTRLFDQLIEQTLRLDKCLRCIEFLDFAMIEHDNAIAVQDCVDAVSD
jgi:hypothetical protein